MNLTIEEKRDRVFDYCDNTGCAEDWKLKNWAGKRKFLNDENCLIIEEATEEELDKALELINNTKIKPLEDSKTEKHKLICEKLNKLYEAKNADYGDSFGKSYMEYGLTMPCIRLEDKLNRLKSLNFSRTIKVKNESIEDTLMDLANYAIMTLIELECED